ncbi:MAG: Y-family DNA polymerase [Sumerlaeia bacterium]
MIALVDCNNFYASCERLFQPQFEKKPVVVLSNNDGCVVARSEEAKEVGIRMGAPAFEVRDLIKRHNVAVFSSNYTLYADMSHRVMETLQQHCPEVEVYSIDEAFVTLPPRCNVLTFCHRLRETVKRETGIPVSIGYAPTKTLAKLANSFAKKEEGVFDFTTADHDTYLGIVPVSKVWGIGGQKAKWLQARGITTALELKNADPRWISKWLTVVGERTVRELRGEPCMEMDDAPPAKKGIMCSRMFGRPVTQLAELEEAVSTYTARVAEKLRAEKGAATILEVFITTGRYSAQYYANKKLFHLPVATADTCKLSKTALEGLRALFKAGHNYTKAGVFVTGIVDAGEQQGDLFACVDDEKRQSFLAVLDSLNQQWGRGAVRYASEGIKKPWHMKRGSLSKRYTTSWGELPQIGVCTG